MEPKTLDQKVDAILRILQGEPFDKNDNGLMGTVQTLKNQVYKLIDWKNRTVAWAIGVSFGGGALIAFIITTILDRKK